MESKRIFEVECRGNHEGLPEVTLRYELEAEALKDLDVDDLLAGTAGLAWDVLDVDDFYADDIREIFTNEPQPGS